MKKCPYCKKINSVKTGVRKNKSGFVQKYECKSCGKSFTPRNGFEKMRTKPEIIVTALDLRAKGMSLGKIQLHIQEKYGVKINRNMILYWQNKFGEQINKFTKQFILPFSENTHADEMFLRIKGAKYDEFIYYWDAIDYKTKFLIADHMSNARTDYHALEFMRKIKNQISVPPNIIHTDNSWDYPPAIKKVFRKKTIHIHFAAWKHKFKNNPIERLHNTIRENYKVMRKFQEIETAENYLMFFRNYHNFLRPHLTLNGATPAEVAGFGKWNWYSLIKDDDLVFRI